MIRELPERRSELHSAYSRCLHFGIVLGFSSVGALFILPFAMQGKNFAVQRIEYI